MADDSDDVIILDDDSNRSHKNRLAVNGELSAIKAKAKALWLRANGEQRPNGRCKNGDGCSSGSILKQEPKPEADKSTPASPNSTTADSGATSCAQNGAGSLVPDQETEKNLFDIFSSCLPNGDALVNDESASSSHEDGEPSAAKRPRLTADDTEDPVDVDEKRKTIDGDAALQNFRKDLKNRASIATMGTCDCEKKRREMDAQIMQWQTKISMILNSYKALKHQVNLQRKSSESRRTVAVQANIPDVTAVKSSVGVGASSATSTASKHIPYGSTPDLLRPSPVSNCKRNPVPASPAVNNLPAQLPASKIRASTFTPSVNNLKLPQDGVKTSLTPSSSASSSRRVTSVQTALPAKTTNCLAASQKQHRLAPAQITSSPLVKGNMYVVNGPQQQTGIRILPAYGAVSSPPKLVRAAINGSVAGTSSSVQNHRVHAGPNVQAHSTTISTATGKILHSMPLVKPEWQSPPPPRGRGVPNSAGNGRAKTGAASLPSCPPLPSLKSCISPNNLAAASALFRPLPPKPEASVTKDDNRVVIYWTLQCLPPQGTLKAYRIFSYQEGSRDAWNTVGNVDAMELPMACTLSSCQPGNRYYFIIVAEDVFGRYGPFSDVCSLMV